MYQRIIFALIRTKPDRRLINFIFNPKGGSGKSLTADYITLNSDFNAVLAPQLTSPDRWVSSFIDQLESYRALNGFFPKTIVFDLTRNEDNLNVEALYSTLENIKNGRVDSTFYGRFKRIRFASPHILVFTNNVPNMSALSQDRLNIFALSDSDHYYTMVKCKVNLRLAFVSKTMVSWYYEATICLDKVQKKFYEEILNADMTALAMSALVSVDGHISTKKFEGDTRTKLYGNAPEPVQELLNKRLSEKT